MEKRIIKKLMLIILLPVLVVWLLYNFYFRDKFNQLSGIKTSLYSMEKEIELLKPKIILLKGKLATTETIEKQINEINKKIPSELEIPSLISGLLYNSAKGLNIDYTFFQPGALIPEEKYKRLPITANITSNFETFYLYLTQLEKLPFTIRVDSVNISKNPDSKNLNISIGMSAFVSPRAVETNKTSPNMSQIPSFDPFYSSRKTSPVASKKIINSAKKKKKKKIIMPIFQGVYNDGEKIFAFINNSIVSIGETVKGYKVASISENRVIVTKGGKRYTLKLGR